TAGTSAGAVLARDSSQFWEPAAAAGRTGTEGEIGSIGPDGGRRCARDQQPRSRYRWLHRPAFRQWIAQPRTAFHDAQDWPTSAAYPQPPFRSVEFRAAECGRKISRGYRLPLTEGNPSRRSPPEPENSGGSEDRPRSAQ